MYRLGKGAAHLAAYALISAGIGIVTDTAVAAADLGGFSPALGSARAPLVGYDAYGYPVFAPTAVHAIAPVYASPGCPVGSQPVYDASGNLAGYGPIRICQ